MKKPLYFDYASTTPVHPTVLESMLPYFSEDFGNGGSSQHYYGWVADEAIELSRKNISSYFGVNPRQLIFTSGATESNNLAIQGFLRNLNPGHIITSVLEHKAVLHVFNEMEKLGWAVTYLCPNSFGIITPEDLEVAMRVDTRLVSLMLVNNELGNMLDYVAISKLCQSRGICFHSDATQALGKIDLASKSHLPDMISFSGHKIYGPKGIGGLLLNAQVEVSSLVYGGGQERSLRPGTLPVQQIVGLSACFTLLPTLMGFNDQLQSYKTKIINGLKGPYIINSNIESSVPHLLNISIPNVDWEDLYRKIPGIAVSNGSACNAKSQLPSHVLLALGRSDSLALASLRISLSYLTKPEDVDFLIDYLNEQLFSA